MKASDCIARFLAEKGVTDAFGYPGAVVCHLMDSLEKTEGICPRLNYHEQASAFAACGFAQASGKMGVAYANGGPGATNLVTGIANAWYDSVPTIFICGQVDTTAMRGALPIRQRGIQEIPIHQLMQPITKYSVLVDDPENLRYELERAYWEAANGRPGPVVLEIPADIQRCDLNWDALKSFTAPQSASCADLERAAATIMNALQKAERPCLHIGNGIKQSHQVQAFLTFLSGTGLPAVFSLPAMDTLPFAHPQNFGFIGMNGHRYSNFILSKADLIVFMGSRADLKQVGTERGTFAPDAQIMRVDVDPGELAYAIRENETTITADLTELLPLLAEQVQPVTRPAWLAVCRTLKERLYGYDFDLCHSYIRVLNELASQRATFTADVGQHEIYLAQALQIREGQKLLLSLGLASMGYSLPAAIGAYYGRHEPVFCMCGDGGFQMNLQELQFIRRENIPVKVIVFNNYALGMIREFQERNFDANYLHSKACGGYSIPDTQKIAAAYDLPYFSAKTPDELRQVDFSAAGPAIIELIVDRPTYLAPRLAKGQSFRDMLPPLEKALYHELTSL